MIRAPAQNDGGLVFVRWGRGAKPQLRSAFVDSDPTYFHPTYFFRVPRIRLQLSDHSLFRVSYSDHEERSEVIFNKLAATLDPATLVKRSRTGNHHKLR